MTSREAVKDVEKVLRRKLNEGEAELVKYAFRLGVLSEMGQ